MPDDLIRVILDTNVFVAAYWAPSSASARLIQACIDGLAKAEYTEEIKREVDYVLRTIKVKENYLSYLQQFWENAELVQGLPVNHIRSEDPDDQKFLEAAAAGTADLVVTNDDHLLRIGYTGRAEILPPSSALKLLRFSSYN